MSNPLMEKMLDLPEFEVADFKQNDNDMGFYVQTKNRPTVCPVCGCYMPNLVIYKSRIAEKKSPWRAPRARQGKTFGKQLNHAVVIITRLPWFGKQKGEL